VTTDKLAGMAATVKKISRISSSEIWQPPWVPLKDTWVRIEAHGREL